MNSNIIDFRSDTLTKPGPEMIKAMAEADVGDDVFEEDPTVQQLEAHVAELLGKESALFVPTGTMSNIIATFLHCRETFSEFICGDCHHAFLYEAAGAAVVARAQCRQIPVAVDGTLPLDKIVSGITGGDVHCPTTRQLILENTCNQAGGTVLPMSYVKACKRICVDNKMALHCDGARLWNAAIASKATMAEVAQPYDTVSVCLSKGLGAPMGSLLVGERNFVRDARHARKMLGGGMRQVGYVAAAGLFAVKHMYDRLADDHKMAHELGKCVEAMGCKLVKPETNIVIWDAGTSKREQFLLDCKSKGLLLTCMGSEGLVRAVPHYGNTIEEVQRSVQIIKEVLEKCS